MHPKMKIKLALCIFWGDINQKKVDKDDVAPILMCGHNKIKLIKFSSVIDISFWVYSNHQYKNF